MKKGILIFLLLLLGVALYSGWQIFGPVVQPPEGGYFYVRTGDDVRTIKQKLLKERIIKSSFFYTRVEQLAKFDKARPGRYKIEQGSNLIDLVKKFRRGNQEPVRLVINKLRTKEDLAGKIGRQFECDSLEAIRFLLSNDSLKNLGVDTHTVMTLVIPNTYELHWNGNFKKVIGRLKLEHDKFWNEERTVLAGRMGLTPAEVYTMASIVEEETNKKEDKKLIASVYINRMKKGMKLEADPTVKYASRNFGLKRILYGHLKYPSPYNTYQVTGLPPGPISTASRETIDAVLHAPQTDYIFFVAKPDFNGYSNFASNYEDHKRFARAYQKALDSLILSKQSK